MATTEVTPQSSMVGAVPNTYTEMTTFYRVVVDAGLDEQGKQKTNAKVVNDKIGEKAAKEGVLDDQGKKRAILTIESQSFVEHFTNNDAGQAELTPDESERKNMYNRGVSTKQDNRARQILLEKTKDGEDWEFQCSETPYDMREDLKQPSKVRLSATEKLKEELATAAFTDSSLAEIEAMIAKRRAELKAAQQAQLNAQQVEEEEQDEQEEEQQ